MPRLSTLPATALLALAATAGCSHSMDASEIKRNPHPKQAYAITVTVEGAPGLFDSVSGSMSYQTANPGCVPPDPISGARVPPSARLAFPVKQVGPYTYRGTLYMDLLKDEDYSGLGVCRWKMAVADLSLRYHGNTFVSALDGEEIRAGRQAKVYFSKADYHDTSQNPMAAFEVPKDKAAYAAAHPELFFSVIVSAKQISQ